jgi:hypothetical protein
LIQERPLLFLRWGQQRTRIVIAAAYLALGLVLSTDAPAHALIDVPLSSLHSAWLSPACDCEASPTVQFRDADRGSPILKPQSAPYEEDADEDEDAEEVEDEFDQA